MTTTRWILLLAATQAAAGVCAWQCYQRIKAGRSMVRVLAVWAVIITSLGLIFLPLSFPQKVILYGVGYASVAGCVLLDVRRGRSKNHSV